MLDSVVACEVCYLEGKTLSVLRHARIRKLSLQWHCSHDRPVHVDDDGSFASGLQDQFIRQKLWSAAALTVVQEMLPGQINVGHEAEVLRIVANPMHVIR